MDDKDNPRVFMPPPLIFSGLLTLGILMDRRPVTLGVVQMFGGALALAAFGLIATALGMFRRKSTRPEPWQPASALVDEGIYRLTRNPMYLGMALLSLGIALVFASLGGVLATVLAAFIIDRAVIPREEAYLLRRFGEDYRNYRSRVRRWL